RIDLRDAGLAEILAHHDVGGELRPLLGNLGVVHLKDDAAVRIGDPAGAPLVLDRREGVLSRLGETAIDLHGKGSIPTATKGASKGASRSLRRPADAVADGVRRLRVGVN